MHLDRALLPCAAPLGISRFRTLSILSVSPDTCAHWDKGSPRLAMLSSSFQDIPVLACGIAVSSHPWLSLMQLPGA